VLIYPPGVDTPLRGDLIVRAVLRSDLTPVPQTIELEVRDTIDTAGLKEGAVCRVGRDGVEFLIIKDMRGPNDGRVQGDRPMRTRQCIGLLASCAPVADNLQRAVVRYGSAIGEIYRACGAKVRIDSEFSVSVFACYKGQTPAFEIAKALQEEGGALVVKGTRVAFMRLSQMLEPEPIVTFTEDAAVAIQSSFLERHTVPFAFSINASGGFEFGRSESGRGVIYRPRCPPYILNNLSAALITRRKLFTGFAPQVLAGMRVDLGEKPFVVVTAAHVFEPGGDADHGEQSSTLWLAEVVK
jgi:hypothetical protein